MKGRAPPKNAQEMLQEDLFSMIGGLGAGAAHAFHNQTRDERPFKDIIASTTDVRRNSRSPYSNGDQSRLKADFPGDPGQSLRDVWSAGADFNPLGNHNLQSEFCRACFCGNLSFVRFEIDRCTRTGQPADGKPSELTKLLEKRESALRLPPLLSTIAGARVLPHAESIMTMACGGTPQHLEVMQALLDAGCSTECADVAGYTPLHHCCSGMASPASLRIALLLGNRGLSSNLLNRFGCPPLLEPVMGNKPNTVAVLLELEADPNLQDQKVGGGSGVSAFRLGQMFPAMRAAMSAAISRQALTGKQGLIGERVKLGGLKNQELNGLAGIVTDIVVETGRYEVLVDGDKSRRVAVEAPHLQPEGLRGQRVQLHGLSRQDLNGQVGTCGDYNPTKARYFVTLESAPADADPLGVRPANLKLLKRDECDGCSKNTKKLKPCSGCMRVRYCSKECQKAAWPVHKPECQAAIKDKAEIQLGVKSSHPKTRHVVVKIQVPIALYEGDPNTALYCYDEKRVIKEFIQSSHPQYEELVQQIRQHGVRMGSGGPGVKGYFNASTSQAGLLTIDVKNMLPIQAW